MADTLSSSAPASTKTEFVATCHCGRVRVKFWADPKRLVAWDCDCSDCKMRQNVHLVVPKDCFRIDMDEALEEATTLYQWGTKTAVRRFCKTCGEFWLEYYYLEEHEHFLSQEQQLLTRDVVSLFCPQESCRTINLVQIQMATVLRSIALTGRKVAPYHLLHS